MAAGLRVLSVSSQLFGFKWKDLECGKPPNYSAMKFTSALKKWLSINITKSNDTTLDSA